MRYAIRPEHEPNRCLECGEVCRRPKKFCSDSDKELFGRGTRINHQGAAQVKADRQFLGETAEALEWKRKRSVQNVF